MSQMFAKTAAAWAFSEVEEQKSILKRFVNRLFIFLNRPFRFANRLFILYLCIVFREIDPNLDPDARGKRKGKVTKN